jgi:hypothetical protein
MGRNRKKAIGAVRYDIFGNVIGNTDTPAPQPATVAQSLVNRLRAATTDEEKASVVGYHLVEQERRFTSTSTRVRGYYTYRYRKVQRYTPNKQQIASVNAEFSQLTPEEQNEIILERMRLARINNFAETDISTPQNSLDRNGFDVPSAMLATKPQNVRKIMLRYADTFNRTSSRSYGEINDRSGNAMLSADIYAEQVFQATGFYPKLTRNTTRYVEIQQERGKRLSPAEERALDTMQRQEQNPHMYYDVVDDQIVFA